jgi:MFS family permease
VRALACLGAAVALAVDANIAVVYVLAVLAAVPLAAHRPSHLALTPLLVRTPRELAASNVAALTFESGAVLLGPAIAALLLAVSGPAAVFGACAVISFLSFVAIAGVRPTMSVEAPAERIGVLHELREGARSLAGNRPVRLVVGLFGSQAFVRGALNVLLVVVAIDVLDMGESGVGVLTAAFGVGGILGATAGVSLVGRGRLGRPFQLSLAGWGFPLVLLAAWPEPWVAVLCLALSGLANSLLDVAGFTIMQENADERVIGRIFGLFELVEQFADPLRHRFPRADDRSGLQQFGGERGHREAGGVRFQDRDHLGVRRDGLAAPEGGEHLPVVPVPHRRRTCATGPGAAALRAGTLPAGAGLPPPRSSPPTPRSRTLARSRPHS